MAKLKKSDFKSAREWIDGLPADRQKKIRDGASKVIAEAHLAGLRRAMATTQTALAQKTGLKQGEISRIENNPDRVQLRTMERYVRGLGGEFRLVAEFPDGTRAEIPLRGGKPVK